MNRASSLLSAHQHGSLDNYTLYSFCQGVLNAGEDVECVQLDIEGCERGRIYDERFFELLSEKEALEKRLKAGFLKIFGTEEKEEDINYIH
jgi:hypothetical protein